MAVVAGRIDSGVDSVHLGIVPISPTSWGLDPRRPVPLVRQLGIAEQV